MKGVKKRVNITVSVPVSTSLRLEYTYIPWDQRKVTGTRDCGKGRWNMVALVFQSAIFSAEWFCSSRHWSQDARCFHTSLALNHVHFFCTHYCTWPLSSEPVSAISLLLYISMVYLHVLVCERIWFLSTNKPLECNGSYLYNYNCSS